MDLPRARRRVGILYQQVGELFETLLGRSPLFAASLYEHRSRCGKPLCKCAKGPYRHCSWCLSFIEDGRSRTRVVPRGLRPAVERLTGDYRRFRQARRELRRLVGELGAAVEAVGRARCEAGWRRYARLVERARGASSRSRNGG